ENEIYWFHPDHLGSTSYITNILGEVSQHMEYFAFGETFVEEHRSSNNSPYKFNGKELDEETGWYYYGARYYDARVSVWLSVDPLAEQTMTPYQYTYQNPLRYIDPKGLKALPPTEYEIIETGEKVTINDGSDAKVRISQEDFTKLSMKYAFDIFSLNLKLDGYWDYYERLELGKIGYQIALAARNYEGSFDWDYYARKDEFKEESYKCNKFVYDIAKEVGAEPLVSVGNIKRPPLASEWATSISGIGGWKKINTDKPHLGDIVGGKYPYVDASGHVVIVSQINIDVSVGSLGTVNSNYIGDDNFAQDVIDGVIREGRSQPYTPFGIWRAK